MNFQPFKHPVISDTSFGIRSCATLLTSACKACLLWAVVGLLVLLFLPQASSAQSKEDFGVNELISTVKKRFDLSSRDVKSIRPLVNQENRNVLEIYARFSGDEPEYSERVWQEIMVRRSAFESDIDRNLTGRQKSALRAARTAMEQRILNYLVQDFVGFLGAFLDLSDWEFSDVKKVFELENERKYQLIAAHLSHPARLKTEMEKVSRETERRLRQLLSPDQWRDYLSLMESPRLTA